MFQTIFSTILLFSGDSVISEKPILYDSLREDVVVQALKASDIQPVSQFNLSKRDIQQTYYGQDIPYLLQSTPSIVAQSDNGTGIGYSYYRMRGIDYTRINFNVNGIPVNDPESQGVFTNNFADLASSAQSIQVQRGIGTTANGTAPIAGSINIVTNDLRTPASFGMTAGYGSFNSSRLTAEYNTGLLQDKFAFYGRLSSLQTDGYRYNSGADLKTYFVSGAYFGKRSILKFNAFGGITRTQLSFNAIDKASYQIDRRSNSLTSAETDEFQQNFYQLQYTYKLNSQLSISSSAYYVKGVAPRFALNFGDFPYFYANMPDYRFTLGNKDTTITSSDMQVSYRINSDFYGGMTFLNYTVAKLTLHIGIHANTFRARHFMEVLSASVFPLGYSSGHITYDNTGYKNEISAFGKASWNVSDKLIVFGDIQIRNAGFSYAGQDKPIFRDTSRIEKMNWIFCNPKIGLRYFVTNNISVYASGGITTREPTRLDYLGDDRANFDVKQSDVKPESVFDIEIGSEIRSSNLFLAANLYMMEFRNEIAATGALNIYGYGIRKNVGESLRRGLEIALVYKVLPKWSLIHNSSFSYNKIKGYTQSLHTYNESGEKLYEADGYTPKLTVVDYKNVDPVLTPNVILNQGIRFEPFKYIQLDLTGRYVSKSYLDNTNNEALVVPEYVVGDLKAAVKLNQWLKKGDYTLSFQLNNVTNTLYAPAGTPYQGVVQDANGNQVGQITTPSFFPAATRNFFLTLQVKI